MFLYCGTTGVLPNDGTYRGSLSVTSDVNLGYRTVMGATPSCGRCYLSEA